MGNHFKTFGNRGRMGRMKGCFVKVSLYLLARESFQNKGLSAPASEDMFLFFGARPVPRQPAPASHPFIFLTTIKSREHSTYTAGGCARPIHTGGH